MKIQIINGPNINLLGSVNLPFTEALHLKITWLIFAKDTLTWRSTIFNRTSREK